MADTFRALLVTKDGDRQSAAVTELTGADLMEGDVTVAVEHSTLNYKDGLAISAHHPQIPAHPRHRLGRPICRPDSFGSEGPYANECDAGHWPQGPAL